MTKLGALSAQMSESGHKLPVANVGYPVSKN